MIFKQLQVFEYLHLSIGTKFELTEEKNNVSFAFSVDDTILTSYVPFCDDFGPLNLASIHDFCKVVEQEIQASNGQPVIMQTSDEQRSLTNAVFLLGPYMIMKLGKTTEQAV